LKIAIASTERFGQLNSLLLAQHNDVVCLDNFPAKLEKLSCNELPIEDVEIEFLKAQGCNFRATINNREAYKGA
jgi:UDP-glucose 6-dehydrogenase